MTYNTLTSADLAVSKPVKTEILTTIKSNQDDHESRISNLESGSGKIILFNEIVDLASYRAGDIRFSMLTVAQFQAKYGTDWVLIDGSSITGTDLAALYGATLPDFRNRFPRIGDDGATRAVGLTEGNQNASHTHLLVDSNGAPVYTNGTGGTGYDYWSLSPGTSNSSGSRVNTVAAGSSEARPDSGVMNAFIRKEDVSIDQIRLFKAPYAFNITNVIVTTLIAGSAGTLEIDILNGSTLGSLTTIFSTKPSVVYTEGNNVSSTNGVISSSSVSVNNWVQLDLTSLQTQQSRFHVLVSGEST